MAGIGDYIHATRINYLKHSLSLYKEQTPPTPQEVYNSQVTAMKNEMARKQFEDNLEKNRQNFERMLNLFFNPSTRTNISKGELNEKDVKMLQEALHSYMEASFGKEIYLDDRTLSVFSGVDVASLNEKEATLLDKVRAFSAYKVASGRSIKGIEDRYAALKAFRDNIAKEKISSTLYQKLQELDSKYADFKKAVANYIAASGNTKIIPTGWLYLNQTNKRFDEELDELIRALRLTNAAKAQGEFGEIVAKASNYVLNHKGRVSKNQILKFLTDPMNKPQKSRKGVKGSLISIYASYRTEDMLKDDSGNKLSFKELQQDDFTVNLTEDKVDATLYFKDFGNINTSIKNYNLSNKNANLKLLGGKNLLALVQDYPVFINHFLNIVGIHTDTNFSPNDIELAHRAMKITAFVKAISGGVYTDQGYSDKVDLLIVNDNSVGGYRVYYLSELLEKILNNIELMNFSKYPDGIWTENDWAPPEAKKDRVASFARITKLVNVMRTMELKISMSSTILN